MSSDPRCRYFIKQGYRHNQVVTSRDDHANGSYWTRERLRSSALYQFPVYQYALSVMRRNRLRSVMDVGCGAATKLAHLHAHMPGVTYVGVDQQSAIDLCRRQYSWGEWLVDDFDRPRAEPAAADLVICADVIEHLQYPDSLLDYLRKRVTHAGFIVLSTPERDLLRGTSCSHCPNPYHVREWNRDELQTYLAESGYRVLDHRLQLPVKLALEPTVLRQLAKRLLTGRALRYNQVLLLQPA